jgi:glutaredoxin
LQKVAHGFGKSSPWFWEKKPIVLGKVAHGFGKSSPWSAHGFESRHLCIYNKNMLKRNKQMFEIIALEHCPYSANAVKTLESLAEENENFKFTVTWVNQQSKEKYKKTPDDTFPQIVFHVKLSDGRLKKIIIGGNDDLDKLIELTQSLKSEFGPQIIVPLLQLIQCL